MKQIAKGADTICPHCQKNYARDVPDGVPILWSGNTYSLKFKHDCGISIEIRGETAEAINRFLAERRDKP